MKLDSDPKNEVKVDISGADQDSGLRSSSKKVAAAKTANSPSEIMLETPTAASSSVTLRTPLLADANDDDLPPIEVPEQFPPLPIFSNNDDENVRDPKRKRPKKITFFTMVGIVYCSLLIVILIISAIMNKLEYKVENVEIWKWCCLGLPFCLGLVFPDWFMNIILKKLPLHGKINDDITKVPFLKMVRSVVNSYRYFTWSVITAIIWWCLIGPSETEPNDATTTLRLILKMITSAVFVAVVWILRSVAIKFLYELFYIKRFSKRIHENRVHQDILQTLAAERGSNVAQIGFFTPDETKDLMKLDEQNNRITTTERKAKAAGDLIFRNVAKPGNRYVEEKDLLHFMEKQELDVVLQTIRGKEESGRIDEKPFLNWVVSMYMKIKFQEHSLNDMLEAMETLVNFVNVLLVPVSIILWLIIADIATTEVVLFIASQFLLAVFTFGNTAKPILEAMTFVFLKHPFDVGDRCVIDGAQVVVEKVSILTTVLFLKYDNEKIYYPNSILATKSISNLDRSSEMRDTVEFDVSASVDNISALKAKIKTYIDRNSHLWQPEHSVWVREVADVNKVKMRLYITHTLNFLDYEEKCDRRSNLVQELMNIFQQLGIKNYQIHPPTSSDK